MKRSVKSQSKVCERRSLLVRFMGGPSKNRQAAGSRASSRTGGPACRRRASKN